MKLNCIAADDEPLALDLIATFIRQTPFLNLMGVYPSAIEALDQVHKNNIDLIFLDIQMPGLSGMELARIIAARQQETKIIFTTAFNQYALEGYKVDALDYLLKPFNFADFSSSASKALLYFERMRKPSALPPVTQQVSSDEDYLFLKVEYQFVKIEFKSILYIESLGDYVKVHLSGQEKPVLSLTTLKALEERLPKNKFLRVHRSFVIALDRIDSVTKNSVAIGDTIINISDQYKSQFSKFLNRWL